MLKTDMSGRTAVVTAGAGVVGAAICKVFAANGAKVAVCDKDEAAAKKVAAEINAAAARPKALRSTSARERRLRASATRSSPNSVPLTFSSTTKAKKLRLRTANRCMNSTWICMTTSSPPTLITCTTSPKPPCRIWQSAKRALSSTSCPSGGLIPVANQTPVVAAAAAQVGFTKMWGVELKEEKIRVNGVAAGIVKNEKNAAYLQTEEQIKPKLSHLP